MDYIQFFEVTKTYGYEKILNEISFKIHSNENIGLIGNNGCGKTTLFKIIMGIESFDKSKMGSVTIRKNLKIGYLEQDVTGYLMMSVLDVLKSAFTETLRAMDELDSITTELASANESISKKLMYRLDELQLLINMNNGYEINDRIKIVAAGLGVERGRHNSLMSHLSGGERTRVFLAKLLLEEPDILLLDEPTNHLDIFAVSWLEKFLKNYRGTVLSISHDRVFLESTVNRIFEIENTKLAVFDGNFSWYKEEKARRLELQEKQYTQQQKEIKRLKKAAKQMRMWAQQADNEAMYYRAKNIERRIEHMNKVDKPLEEYKSMDLNLSSTRKSGREIIRIENLKKAYNGIELFESPDLLIRRGEKVVISGENGCGKTTLLNILTGYIEPDDGVAVIGSGVSYGLLSQEIVFEDPSRSILNEVRHMLMCDSQKAHRSLASFGFKGEHVMKRVSELSGGEQKRLRLCTIMQKKYSLLIMDEPTNHMDISSREIIEEAVTGYEGTCLFISHDRYFIQTVCTRKILMDNGTFKEYDGDYTRLIEINERSPKKNTYRNNKTDSKKMSKNRTRDLEKIETEIHSMEAGINKLGAKMQSSTDYSKLSQMLTEKSQIEKKLTLLYDEWNKKF